MISLCDNSRAEHSSILSNIDYQRISRQLEKVIFNEKMDEFFKVENMLYGKYENMEIMTHEELEKQVEAAYKKILNEDNN